MMYRYSNINFILLGLILETVYNKGFNTIITENILVPANMEQTLTTDFNVENKVTGSDSNGVAQKFFNWNTLVAPAGLLKSNTADMIKFLNILLSNAGDIAEANQRTNIF
ncbi:serine hydrolase domain-containing protein [Formosa sp. PL04]|uniref:serine hydrolase domain-containing protein n=1 Tax=Formosa sp. PL04 TaxID=3081755 RepID=UPI002982A3BD|nr:serine hydrolase domain-containing protein [Formosa sp. PL04]MDW5289782.1 serine hydrolase domain-containing protein [Formosa sp. PL04]